jgi:thioredoxin reductase (NADPH)
MLTSNDIASMPVFSALSPDTVFELVKAAADIHLKPGEYVVHEGDEPALFVVLAGNLEITKLIDGIERTIGHRQLGKIHGEVPLIYGTPFQGGARASELSRVVRIGAQHYYNAAAASPQLAEIVRELARERIGGLQGIVAEPRRAQVTMIGQRWDTASLDLRRFLSRNQITFDWLPLDANDLAARWPGKVPAERDCPALRLADGRVFLRPQPRQLAERLGLQTNARLAEYDTIIIGGGPAGLAAAVYGASEGLRTLVVEREAPGGQAGTSSRIENYLGFPSGISGDELSSRALRQAKRLGAEIVVTRQIVSIDPEARTIALDHGELLHGRTFIIATGVSWQSKVLTG